MDVGDIPAWLALLISIVTGLHQRKVNAAAESARIASEHESSRQRETDQRHLRIEQIYRDVEDITLLATDYWMRPGSETGASGVLITSKIRDVSSRISRYGAFLWPSANQDILTFKQAVTGGVFQQVSRDAVKPTSDTVRKISLASSTLKEKLRHELDRLDMPSRY